jgi:hypothetical protein
MLHDRAPKPVCAHQQRKCTVAWRRFFVTGLCTALAATALFACGPDPLPPHDLALTKELGFVSLEHLDEFVGPGFGGLVDYDRIPEVADRLAVTLNTARAFGNEDRAGRVTVGMQADLVVVERDPLHDLGVLRRPWGVAAQGSWLDRTGLDELLEQGRGGLR